MDKKPTIQDILELLDKSNNRFDKRLEKERKERTEGLQAFEKLLKEYDDRLDWERRQQALRLKETGKSLKEIKKMLGNIGNNNGDVAEEFFYNGLENKMSIGIFRFDSIGKRVKEKRGNVEDEFDIILTNSNTVVITEVKYKFHPDDVGKLLSKKIPNFKKLFPHYENFKIYGAIAALSLPDDTKNIAIEKGFFVLTQSGENIKLVNDKVKSY